MDKHTLKLDYDDKTIDCSAFTDRLLATSRILEFEIGEIDIKETKKGFHVQIELTGTLCDWELVVIQMCLQSDWIRELLNARKVKFGTTMKEGNILFKEKRVFTLQNGTITDEEYRSKEEKTGLCLIYEKLIKHYLELGESRLTPTTPAT